MPSAESSPRTAPWERLIAAILTGLYIVITLSTFSLLAAGSMIVLSAWLPWWLAAPLGIGAGTLLFIGYDLATSIRRPHWDVTGILALRCIPLLLLLLFLLIRYFRGPFRLW